MGYIVWKNKYKVNALGMRVDEGISQGDGYFVKWKNKLEDEFSTNWFDANKYKTIGPALTRLGLDFNDSMKSIDDFLNQNGISKSYNREKTISEILGDKSDSVLIFQRGHIDKIDDEGNFCGNAGKEVLEYVEAFIQKNIQKDNSIKKKFESLGVGNYIDKSVSNEDFWNEVLKK